MSWRHRSTNIEKRLGPRYLKTLAIDPPNTTLTLLREEMPEEAEAAIEAVVVEVEGVVDRSINRRLPLSPHVTTVAKAITTLKIAGPEKARERRNGKLVKIKELIVPKKVIVTIITLTTITLKDK